MGTVTKPNEFSSGATIFASEHNSNFDTIYNEFNGNIENVNIKSGAAIVGSKLDLTSPGAIGSTAANTGAFTTLTASGATTLNGDTTIGNASGDALTYHSNAWTLTNGVTITGTWADLGAVTTVDINGGTIGGVTLDGTIGIDIGSDAHGDVYFRNSSGDLARLAVGTSGQKLTTNGAAADPTWANQDYQLIDSETLSGDSTSKSFTIAATKSYFVDYILDNAAATDANVRLRFNALTANYTSHLTEDDFTGTKTELTDTTFIRLGGLRRNSEANHFTRGFFRIDTYQETNVGTTISAFAHGDGFGGVDTGGGNGHFEFWGRLDASATITAFTIDLSASTFNGSIRLWEIVQS